MVLHTSIFGANLILIYIRALPPVSVQERRMLQTRPNPNTKNYFISLNHLILG